MDENKYASEVASGLFEEEKNRIALFARIVAGDETLFFSVENQKYLDRVTKDDIAIGKVKLKDMNLLQYRQLINRMKNKINITSTPGNVGYELELFTKDQKLIAKTNGITPDISDTGKENFFSQWEIRGVKTLVTEKGGRLFFKGVERIFDPTIGTFANPVSSGTVIVNSEIDTVFIGKIKKIINKELIVIKDKKIFMSTIYNNKEMVKNSEIDLKDKETFKEIIINKEKMGFNFFTIEDAELKKEIVIGVGFYNKYLEEINKQSIQKFIKIEVLLSLLLFLILHVFLMILFRPFNTVLTGIKAIGEGNYDKRIRIKTGKELKIVADNVNLLSETVERRELELKELNNMLETRNQKLIEVDHIKDNFLANTSHELRTPINGIIGLSESLIDGATGELPERTIYNLNMISVSGKRLLYLINDILDFSKMMNKELVVHKRNTDIVVIIDTVLKMCKIMVGNKNIVLENNLPKDFPYVIADENRLQQVIYNLVGNAIKFTDRGKVTLYGVIKDGNAIISIADTGIGIPKDKYEKIFEVFEQIEDSNVRQYGGTGLGLSITKKLLELMGGKISVDSIVGKGTIFSFSLPISKNDNAFKYEAEVISTTKLFKDTYLDTKEDMRVNTVQTGKLIDKEKKIKEPDVDEGKKYKILVVDDEQVNIEVLLNYFSMQDTKVDVAMNGFEALEKVEKNEFDIILLDVMMPRMSGYEVTQKIREKYSASELPILMLTAKNQPEDVLKGFDAGANDYLTKPFEKRELFARVKTLVLLKRTVKEAMENIKKL